MAYQTASKAHTDFGRFAIIGEKTNLLIVGGDARNDTEKRKDVRKSDEKSWREFCL